MTRRSLLGAAVAAMLAPLEEMLGVFRLGPEISPKVASNDLIPPPKPVFYGRSMPIETAPEKWKYVLYYSDGEREEDLIPRHVA